MLVQFLTVYLYEKYRLELTPLDKLLLVFASFNPLGKPISSSFHPSPIISPTISSLTYTILAPFADHFLHLLTPSEQITSSLLYNFNAFCRHLTPFYPYDFQPAQNKLPLHFYTILSPWEYTFYNNLPLSINQSLILAPF